MLKDVPFNFTKGRLPVDLFIVIISYLNNTLTSLILLMKNSLFYISKLVLLFVLIGNYASAQGNFEWTLKENTQGIKVFTRDVANSGFKAIKVECILNTTLHQLVAALMDVNGSEDWLYHTTANHLVKQISPSELYYYSMVEIPWPMSNRDFIAHLNISQHPITKIVTLNATCNPDMVPRKPNIVRITYSKSEWVLTPLKTGQIQLVYTIHADPGGNIPAWLSNLFVTQGPLQSIKKLKICLEKPLYKSARFDYISE